MLPIDPCCESLVVSCETGFNALLKEACEGFKDGNAIGANPKAPPQFDETPVSSNCLFFPAIDLNFPPLSAFHLINLCVFCFDIFLTFFIFELFHGMVLCLLLLVPSSRTPQPFYLKMNEDLLLSSS